MTTPKVQYSYADGSANTIRPTRTTYPDGRELNLDYGSAGGMDDLLSRVGALVDDDGVIHLTDASYLGLGTPVITDYTQPDVMYTLVGTAGGNDPDTGDIYRGLDRFGRVKDAYWRDYGASADAARIQYGYDRAGNRTYRADPVAVANGAPYEELYGYDAIQRLKTMDRGTLNGTKTALTTKSFDQCWTLDPTGNWKGFRQDDTGDGSWDLVQARTANPVNEITGITNSVGSTWVTPAYNAAGNMTTIPQPADPTQSYTATYDAWNRLVKLTDGANTVAEYQYDARNYRTVQKSYTAGTLTETRHFYYSSNWQVLEERVGTSPDSSNAERQFVWGQRYIDDLVLRDRDTDGNGTLDERLYALQDGNWNVIALTNTSGDVQERYAYQAYGTPKFLTPGFGNRSSSSFAWETLYCGYRWEPIEKIFHIRNRAYHSILGIWLQRDPYNKRRLLNLYDYCHGIPVTTIDPEGLEVVFCGCSCTHTGQRGSFYGYSREEVVVTNNAAQDCASACASGSDAFDNCSFNSVRTATSHEIALIRLCDSISQHCPSCTKEDCEQIVATLFRARNATRITTLFGRFVGTNTCQRWVNNFSSKLPGNFYSSNRNGCLRDADVQTWNLPWYRYPSTQHLAYKVVFCDGSTVYFDNGAVGGSDDHLFFDDLIPNDFIDPVGTSS